MQKGRFLRSVLVATLSLSLLLMLNWLPVLFRPQVALASSFVVGSDPVDGSTINVPPTRMRIFFNTPVSRASTAIIYFGPEYQVMNAGHSYVTNNNPHELDTPLLAHLPEGSYTVRWTAVSNTDGRTTNGVIGFNIGHSSTGLPGQVILGPSTSNILPELSSLGIVAIAWDWLVMAALTLWIGILVMEGIVLANGKDESGSDSSAFRAGIGRTTRDLSDHGARSNTDQSDTEQQEPAIQNSINVGASPVPTFPPIAQIRKQSLPLQWLCLAALVVGEIINLILRAALYTQTFNTAGIDPTVIREILFESRYGQFWMARIALVGVALGLLAWTSRSSRRTPTSLRNAASSRTNASTGYTLAMLTLAGLIVFTLALSDDITQLAQTHASAVILDCLFLIAQGIWFGGAAYLGFILLPLLPALEPELHAQSLVTLIRRSVPLFAGSIGVLLVSGLFLAETSLSSIQQLITDPFGRALLVRIIVIAVMLLLSIYALFFLMPKLRRQLLLLHVVNREMPARRMRQAALERNERRLTIFMKALTFLGVGALLCTAFMVFFAPPIVFPAMTYTNSSGANTSSSTTDTQVIQTQQVGNIITHMQVIPARADYANTVIVSLNDSNGTPITNAKVRITTNMLAMDMGTSGAVIDGGNPTYVAVFKKGDSFSMPGLWNIALNIQRPNQAPVQVSFQVIVSG